MKELVIRGLLIVSCSPKASNQHLNICEWSTKKKSALEGQSILEDHRTLPRCHPKLRYARDYCKFSHDMDCFKVKQIFGYEVCRHTFLKIWLRSDYYYLVPEVKVLYQGMIKFYNISVMSEYHKMDTNKYSNIFGCHIMYRTNIRIYLNATYLPKEYPNIFVLRK